MTDTQNHHAMIIARASGKLYIGGEYAVMDGQASIVVALNRYVTVRVEASHDGTQGIITSTKTGYAPLVWERMNGVITIQDTQTSPSGGAYAYVLSAIRTVERLAVECQRKLNVFQLHIDSDLDEADGRKFGLGSSAAVTVATVNAICQWYNLNVTVQERAKLALIASSMIQGSGSGGDIAASTYGGWILYRAYQREWVRDKTAEHTIKQMLAMPWPQYEIQRIQPAKNLQLLVGWTGSPISSATMVEHVRQQANHSHSTHSITQLRSSQHETNQSQYRQFLSESEHCVQALRNHIELGDIVQIRHDIARNRTLLAELGAATNTPIETPALTTLIECAMKAGAASKTSGAGGGDCGIAIVDPQQTAVEQLLQAWQNHGIQPLHVEIAPEEHDICKKEETGQTQQDRLAAWQKGQDYLKAQKNKPLQKGSVKGRDVTTDASIIMRRKNEHIALAQTTYVAQSQAGFDDIQFLHNALPQTAVEQVDTSIELFNHHIASPFYINAMTGGSQETEKINAALAYAAHKTGIAIASGSVSAALHDTSLEHTFSIIRKNNPDGPVFANVSAGASVDDARRAISMLDANALQIHLNAAQELVMPEGDRDMRAWLEHIYQITHAGLGVPIIVKETGCGMSGETALQLANAGVDAIDVSGRGGTNFVRIENARRNGVCGALKMNDIIGDDSCNGAGNGAGSGAGSGAGKSDENLNNTYLNNTYSYLDDWGITTVESLLDVQAVLRSHKQARQNASQPHNEKASITVLASGGVRTPLDVVRALALGAHAVGVSGVFLQTLLRDGKDALIAQITTWQQHIRTIMALLGASKIDDVGRAALLIRGKSADFAQLRGVDLTEFAQRKPIHAGENL